ncbi:TATA element modulatory factor 1 TATA binding-domain-containing protein [Dichotomopilus funicola]|uniref:TATA element modulatory factor 1 TATA binding-domain-containing protein n=1 Tax=Dichotomopilus funicola TaxID=1934379 RepID=A0AAN6UX34_9PEZI|nr:TATA element modulatory factor 1 TATA binding-domain-containing protein [Dichotomopilus funicola]
MAARWGSFLSQAVAGVEARLDNILAEDEDGQPLQQQKESSSKPSTPTPPVKQSPSRAASTTRTNDRLQERLARAMAAKAAARNSMSAQGSPRQSFDAPNRSSIDSIDRPSPSPTSKEFPKDTPSPRASQDIARTSQDGGSQPDAKEDTAAREAQTRVSGDESNGARASLDEAPPRAPTPTAIPDAKAPVAEPQDETKTTADAPDTTDRTAEVEEKESEKAQDPQSLHQEEIHGYVERIDALEAKLQFLAREASDSARQAALAAPAGSLEKKLAEKDQQIAQLIEEGKNLASTDHRHRALVKKLRTNIAENEKDIGAFQTAKAKSDRELEALRSRARRADELEKTHHELQKRFDQTQRELNTHRSDVRSKDSTISELRSQLRKATEQADAMTAKVNDQAREQDKRKIAELEEELAAVKVEKNLVADRGKAQATELREKADRATERARALEIELKGEVQALEGKLEAMRMRAEEASSGVAGDSQAKLLRQVETLQTQYSIASENWQGIETSLLARIGGMERERDEALQRESDMRRKAREAAVRAKRQAEELEEAKTQIPTIQEDVKSSYQKQLDALKKRAEEAEAALAKARAEFEQQKQSWDAEKEEQRQQLRDAAPERPRSWLEGLPGNSFLKPDSRPASPQLATPQRTFSTDFLGISSLSSKARKVSGNPSSASDAGAAATFDPRFSRRPSAQHPPVRPTIASPPTGSGVFSPLSILSPTSEAAPSAGLGLGVGLGLVHNVQRGEDAFSPSPTLEHHHHQPPHRTSSPQPILPQDLISVSTVAAGPSVQLVERMSAAIRRLESEKVTAREELARIARQRDDARGEIVALMREVEAHKAAVQKVEGLEGEVAEVKARYGAALELLGEKSEEVEELRADVADVKAMYRDLVERTVK